MLAYLLYNENVDAAAKQRGLPGVSDTFRSGVLRFLLMITNTITRTHVSPQRIGSMTSTGTVPDSTTARKASIESEQATQQTVLAIAYATAGPTALYAMVIIVFAGVALNSSITAMTISHTVSVALLLTITFLSVFFAYLSQKLGSYHTGRSLLFVAIICMITGIVMNDSALSIANQLSAFSTLMMSITTTISINGVWEECLSGKQNEISSTETHGQTGHSIIMFPIHIWRSIIVLLFAGTLFIFFFFPALLNTSKAFQFIRIVPIALGVGMAVVLFELGRSLPQYESIMHRVGLLGITIQIIFLLVPSSTLLWNAAICLMIAQLFIIGVSLITRQQHILQTMHDSIKRLALENTQLREQRVSGDIVPIHSADQQEWMWMAAHDLQHPITSLIMGASTFVYIVENQGNTKLAKIARSIYSSSNRLKRQFDLFLDSVIGLPPQLNLKETPILDLITAVIDDERVYAADQVFQYNEPPIGELGATINESIQAWWDKPRIEAVIMNLIKNAQKYSASIARIDIYIWQDNSKQEIHFLIRDQGEGMSAETLAHLFTPFFRAHHTQKSVAGHGLGLAMVKTIIEQHHGCIHIESTVGKGTSVYFTLPIDARTDLDDL